MAGLLLWGVFKPAKAWIQRGGDYEEYRLHAQFLRRNLIDF